MIDTKTKILPADLANPSHQSAILLLLNAYALDPMGDGKELSDYAKTHLISGLAAHPTTQIYLAYHDVLPVGLAICFWGFSTFAAKPLINIHDLVVLPDFRGQGIGRQLLAAVETGARAGDCCKLTLEVQEKNSKARKMYRDFGFDKASYVTEAGQCLFYVKPLA